MGAELMLLPLVGGMVCGTMLRGGLVRVIKGLKAIESMRGYFIQIHSCPVHVCSNHSE